MLIKICKIGILLGMLGFTIYGAYRFGETNVISIKAETVDSMPAKIEKLKDEVIDKLISCESQGYKESDAPIIYDTNKKMSIGLAQFQIATVIYYEKVLYNRQISAKEAVLIALDEQETRELAKDIIFKTKSGVIKDWYNCSIKYKLQDKVNLIKEIEAK